MKFAADCMLGTLAKWLIILGHDVFYDSRIEDRRLVEIARREPPRRRSRRERCRSGARSSTRRGGRSPRSP